MTNTRLIQPINFWRDGQDVQATSILLYNFHGYNFNDTDSWVSYKLGVVEVIGEETSVFTSYFEGSIPVPNTVVQEWGEDDEPIFDYVINTLNLTRDE